MRSSRLPVRRAAGLAFASLVLLILVSARGARTIASSGPQTGQQREFVLGADISALDAPRRFGRPHRVYQEDGKPSDELSILERDGVMYWAPEWDAWNEEGSPGPVVFTLDHLADLAGSPGSLSPPRSARDIRLRARVGRR
jgi:hypothetical protein